MKIEFKVKTFLVIVAYATLTNIAYSQTPYDDFAPSTTKKEILKLPNVSYRAINNDTLDVIRYIELDKEYLTLSYYDKYNILLKKAYLEPTTFKWWSIDPRAEKYTSLSPYNYCANNPILYIDPNGDTLAIANNQTTLSDINSLVMSGNQQYINFSGNGSFSQVSLNFGSMSQDAINALLASDVGLSLLNNLVVAGQNYLYEASEIALVRDESGNRTGVAMFMDNNGVVNASNNGLDANGKNTFLPTAGYDGQVVISSQGSWSEVNQNTGTVVAKSRSSIVFHELAENYQRTTNGINYHGSGSILGAHNIAVSQEQNWYGKSLTPGGIAPNGYSNPYNMRNHGAILNAINQLYLLHGFGLK